MIHRRSSKGLVVLFTFGMAYLLLSMDWRGRPSVLPPRLVASWRATGPWSAGAAKVDLAPRLPTTVAGYPPWRPTAKWTGPLAARALIVSAGGRYVGIVSAEVLEIPESVARSVRVRGQALGLSGVVVTATHTHTSFGGYDRNPLAQIAGTGRFDASLESHLTDALIEALAIARREARPVTLRVAGTRLASLSANRNVEGGPVDDRLVVLACDDSAGRRLGQLVVFGSHATLAPRSAAVLDGDWPGRAMAKLEEASGAALVLQGAVGDVTSRPPVGDGDPSDRMGEAIARAASETVQGAGSPSGSISFASVELGLPRAEADAAVPAFLRRPAANVLQVIAPRTAEVAVLRLPGITLLFVPAEVTTGAAGRLRDRLAPFVPSDDAVAVISLAQGYLGYAETAEATKEARGEARRTLFGPDLLERIATALATGLEATRPDAAPTARP